MAGALLTDSAMVVVLLIGMLLTGVLLQVCCRLFVSYDSYEMACALW